MLARLLGRLVNYCCCLLFVGILLRRLPFSCKERNNCLQDFVYTGVQLAACLEPMLMYEAFTEAKSVKTCYPVFFKQVR